MTVLLFPCHKNKSNSWPQRYFKDWYHPTISQSVRCISAPCVVCPRLVVLPSHRVLAAPSGRLKVNMGNIYVKQKNYPKAIKMYRMALDQVSNTNKEMRIKIMQNIGLVFVRMGQYTDAITSFEHIMSESPNIKTGFNLILCYFAIGDRERMKKAFQKLISVPLGIDDEDKYILSNVSVNFVFIFGSKASLTWVCGVCGRKRFESIQTAFCRFDLYLVLLIFSLKHSVWL